MEAHGGYRDVLGRYIHRVRAWEEANVLPFSQYRTFPVLSNLKFGLKVYRRVALICYPVKVSGSMMHFKQRAKTNDFNK